MGMFKTATEAVTSGVTGGDQYLVEVNKNDLNVRAMTAHLNSKWKDGWRLAHVFEQNGNTVTVFERRPAGV